MAFHELATPVMIAGRPFSTYSRTNQSGSGSWIRSSCLAELNMAVLSRRTLEHNMSDAGVVRASRRRSPFVIEDGEHECVSPFTFDPYVLPEMRFAAHPDLLGDPDRSEVARIDLGADPVEVQG